MRVDKILLISVPLVAASTNVEAKSGAKDGVKRPNILCITCEDISPYLGCYGDTVAKSPNLDRFANDAIRLSQMHTTVGVSAPSRFALITGMYPSAMGANYMRTYTTATEQLPSDIVPYYVILPDEVKGYSEYLREAGYYCTNNNKTDYQFNVPLSLWDECGTKAHWKSRPEGAPFFAIFNSVATHESGIWKYGESELFVDPKDVVVPPYYPDNDIVRHDLAVMYSNIVRMDRWFQNLVDELKAAGEYDNTIIIWYSDNGGPLPRQKRSIYESGTHVPFMIHFPDGYGAGTVDDRLAMFIDIPATILSLAGIEPPKYMHGQALFGEYASKRDREYVYAARDRMDEWYDKQGAIRDSRYRYIRNYTNERPNYMAVNYRLTMPLMRNLVELYERGELNDVQSRWFDLPRDKEEFYDDVADPHNINNLIDDPQYQDKIAQMRKDFDKWVDEYTPRWRLSEAESRDLMLPDGVQPKLGEVKIESRKGLVVLTTEDRGASLVYRVNGKGPSSSGWSLYSGPIEGLRAGDVVTAVATRAGYENSPEATYNL